MSRPCVMICVKNERLVNLGLCLMLMLMSGDLSSIFDHARVASFVRYALRCYNEEGPS